MKILERQLETLLQSDERRWLGFVCDAVEVAHPRTPLAALDDGDARLLLARDWCDRARANGLRTDDEILAFVYLMHEFAPNFDQHPTLRAILDGSDAPLGERWQRLFDVRDEALERAWQEMDEPGASTERDWHVERFDSIEEAFPTTHGDPRFVRYFREVKARHADGLPPRGG
jgi:hypothetical protein